MFKKVSGFLFSPIKHFFGLSKIALFLSKARSIFKKISKRATTRRAIITELAILLGIAIVLPLGYQLWQSKFGADSYSGSENITTDYKLGPFTVADDGTIPDIELPPVALQKLRYAQANGQRFLLGFRDVSTTTPETVHYTIGTPYIQINNQDIKLPSRWFNDTRLSTNKTVDAYGNLDDPRSMGDSYGKDYSYMSVAQGWVNLGYGPSYATQPKEYYSTVTSLVPFNFENYNSGAEITSAKLILGKATFNLSQFYNLPNKTEPAAGRKFELVLFEKDLNIYADTGGGGYPAQAGLYGFRSLELKEFFMIANQSVCKVALSSAAKSKLANTGKKALAFLGSSIPKFSANIITDPGPSVGEICLHDTIEVTFYANQYEEFFPADFDASKNSDLVTLRVTAQKGSDPPKPFTAKNGETIKLTKGQNYNFFLEFASGDTSFTGNAAPKNQVYATKVLMLAGSGATPTSAGSNYETTIKTDADFAPAGATTISDGGYYTVGSQPENFYGYREHQSGSEIFGMESFTLNKISDDYSLYAYYKPNRVNKETPLAVRIDNGDGDAYGYSVPISGWNWADFLYSTNMKGQRAEYRSFEHYFTDLPYNMYYNTIVIAGKAKKPGETMTKLTAYDKSDQPLSIWTEKDFTSLQGKAPLSGSPEIGGTEMEIPWEIAKNTVRVGIDFGPDTGVGGGDPPAKTYSVKTIATPPSIGSFSGVVTPVKANDSVSVKAVPKQGYKFVAWSDSSSCANKKSDTCLFTMPAKDQTLEATFDGIAVDPPPPTNYQVSASANPVVAAVFVGLKQYLAGDKVTVFANTSPGYTFTSWSQSSICPDKSSVTCAFDMPSANVDLSATFTQNVVVPPPATTYQVMASSNPPGVASFIKTGRYAPQTPVSVFANANPGYSFTSWSNPDCSNQQAQTCSLVVGTSDVTLNANFTKIVLPPPAPKYTVSFGSSANGVTSGDGSYAIGAAVTVTATASPGYSFYSWMKDGAVESMDSVYVFAMPDKNVNLTPIYYKTNDILNVGPSKVVLLQSTGGTISASNFVQQGRYWSIDVNVAMQPGYRLSSIDDTVGGNRLIASSANPYKYKIMNIVTDRIISPTFEKITYNLTFVVTPSNGGIGWARPATAKYGESLTINAQPYKGFKLDSISFANRTLDISTPVGPNQYKIDNIDADYAVRVVFVPLPTYLVEVGNDQNGMASPPMSYVTQGLDTEFEIAAKFGYRISSISDGDSQFAPIDASDMVAYKYPVTKVMGPLTINVQYVPMDTTEALNIYSAALIDKIEQTFGTFTQELISSIRDLLAQN